MHILPLRDALPLRDVNIVSRFDTVIVESVEIKAVVLCLEEIYDKKTHNHTVTFCLEIYTYIYLLPWVISSLIIDEFLLIFREIYSATNLEDLKRREIPAHRGNGKGIHGQLQSVHLAN